MVIVESVAFYQFCRLMEDLRAKSYDFAVTEMDELKAFAKKQGFEGDLKSWDLTYYAERMREAMYSYQVVLRTYIYIDVYYIYTCT